MDLMDKFSAVEIKADERISEEDRAFCVLQQKAFDKAAPALQKIADAIIAAKTEQQKILGSDDDKYTHLSPWGLYISDNTFKCGEDDVYAVMKRRNERFITKIVDYFQGKYTLNLSESEIKEHLIPTAPKEPRAPWGGYSQISEEDMAKFEEKLAAYNAEKQAYENKMRNLPLRYDQIVDEIFVQLGGFSFQEKAMNEFLDKCWSASHDKRWDTKEIQEKFEVKNDTLRLTGYWFSCRARYDGASEWSSTDSLKIILNAIVHFDIGQLNRGAEWFPDLFSYSTQQNNFLINNLLRTRNIRLFKNGRVDIKFRDAATAQEFVESYLRKNAV